MLLTPYFLSSDWSSLFFANFDRIIPYLDAANAIVEHVLGYDETDYFYLQSTTSLETFIKNKHNDQQQIDKLEKFAISAYLSLYVCFMKEIVGLQFSFEKTLTSDGIKYMRDAVFDFIQFPLSSQVQTANWLYADTTTLSNDYTTNRFHDRTFITLKPSYNFNLNYDKNKYSINCTKSFLNNILDELTRNDPQKNEINSKVFTLLVFMVEPVENNFSEISMLIYSLVQVKRLVEGDENLQTFQSNRYFTVTDLLNFRNILFKIKLMTNSCQYLGQLIIDLLKIAKRKKLFNEEQVEKRMLEQRFRMWQFKLNQGTRIYPTCCFLGTPSLPYKGLNISQSKPYIYEFNDCILYSNDLDDVENSLENYPDYWNNRWLCSAEVRYLLAVHWVKMLIWLLSDKDEMGKVTNAKVDGILFEKKVNFSLDQGEFIEIYRI